MAASLRFLQAQASPDFRKRHGSHTSAPRLDHLPETRVAHRQEILELFALDPDDQGGWAAMPRDQYSVGVSLIDVAAMGFLLR